MLFIAVDSVAFIPSSAGRLPFAARWFLLNVNSFLTMRGCPI